MIELQQLLVTEPRLVLQFSSVTTRKNQKRQQLSENVRPRPGFKNLPLIGSENPEQFVARMLLGEGLSCQPRKTRTIAIDLDG